jgi:hypothetical protein
MCFVFVSLKTKSTHMDVCNESTGAEAGGGGGGSVLVRV